MRIRRQGFALIAVVLAVAAVFAVTVYGAVVLRATLTESNALATQSRDAVAAHAAASLAVKGLIALPADAGINEPQQLDSMGGLAGSSAGAPTGGGGGDAAPAPEFPAFIAALLGEVGEQIQQSTTESVGARGGDRVAASALTSGDTNALPTTDLLRAVGLPQRPITVELDAVTCTVTMADSLGKLNINTAEQAILQAYLDALDLPPAQAQELTNQILDWIDTDTIPRRGSLEAPGYATLGLTPADGPLRYIDELRFLPAMTPRVMDAINRDFAVGTTGALYVPAASEPALKAIGLADRQVQQITDRRDAGQLDQRSLRLIVDYEAERWRNLLTLTPSPLVSLTVHVFPNDGNNNPSRTPSSVFEGIAVITADGLRDLALRPKVN